MKKKNVNFTEEELEFLSNYKKNLEHKISNEYDEAIKNCHLVHLFYIGKSYVHEKEVKQDIIKLLKKCKSIIRRLKEKEKTEIEKNDVIDENLKNEMKKLLDKSFSQKNLEINLFIEWYDDEVAILEGIIKRGDKSKWQEVDFNYVKNEFKKRIKEGRYCYL